MITAREVNAAQELLSQTHMLQGQATAAVSTRVALTCISTHPICGGEDCGKVRGDTVELLSKQILQCISSIGPTDDG